MANWAGPASNLNKQAADLGQHVQSLSPGVYVLTIVKRSRLAMTWDVLPVPIADQIKHSDASDTSAKNR